MKTVFLSYSHADEKYARKLFRALSVSPNVHVWFDREDILPGMRWKPAINKAIRESDFFIALMSKSSVTPPGFRNAELYEGLEKLKNYGDYGIFLIPARINECEPPYEELRKLSYADLFPDWDYGVNRIRKSLGIRISANSKRNPGTSPLDGYESTAKSKPVGSKSAESKPKTPPFSLAAKSAGKRPAKDYHYQVGLIDVESRQPELHSVAEELNRLQSFCFLETSALAPSRKAIQTFDSVKQLNVDDLSNVFYRKIAPLDKDFVVCTSPRLLAISDDEVQYWNYLSVEAPVDERIHFTSTFGIRDLAEEASVTYEHALAYGLIGNLVSYFLDLEYHRTIRGCPMDFTEDHGDIVKGMRKRRFCASCLKKLNKNKSLEQAVNNMLHWEGA